jgi:hypothetical protein
MVDRSGNARPVFGISASVTIGDPVASGVVSSACSGTVCLFKTAQTIISGTQTSAAPAGPAEFAIDGATALIYFPHTGELDQWADGHLTPVEFRIDGVIAAMRSVSGVAQFAVRRRGGTWIVNEQDQVIGSIPAATGPVLLLNDGVLYTQREQVVLRRTDGSEMRFSVAKPVQFAPLSDSYIQIRTPGASFALRIDPGHENLFQLPEVEQ